MHWFHNISMDTEIKDIGWTYVIGGIALAFLIYFTIMLIKEWKR